MAKKCDGTGKMMMGGMGGESNKKSMGGGKQKRKGKNGGKKMKKDRM